MSSIRLVEILWIDSQNQDGWVHTDSLPVELKLSRTRAPLIDETDEFVTCAHTDDQQTSSYNGVITIPKKAIVSIRTLCRVKK